MFRSGIKIISFILCAGSALSVHSQSFFNKASTVSILENTVFSVKDSLVNTGTFINNGNLVIGGMWLNTGAYDPGIGEITFNSTSPTIPQIINHNNQSFSKLTISGGGKKLILADITIEEQLVLTDGVIETENNSKVIINPAASITGGSDQSHIHAPVYHHGSGEKLFPLGNGTVYLPVVLPEVEDPNAVIGIEEVEVVNTPLLKAPSLEAISNTRYWHIDVAAGTLKSQVTLPVRGELQFADLGKVVVVQSVSLTENFESIGQSVAEGTLSNGTVTSNFFVGASAPFIALASSNDDGSIFVYNAISPNGDGDNEFLRILNIEYYPENKFSVFNRWGDKVFEIENYDNTNEERRFTGKSNINGEKALLNGTYFYVIETKGRKKVQGFLALKN